VILSKRSGVFFIRASNAAEEIFRARPVRVAQVDISTIWDRLDVRARLVSRFDDSGDRFARSNASRFGRTPRVLGYAIAPAKDFKSLATRLWAPSRRDAGGMWNENAEVGGKIGNRP